MNKIEEIWTIVIIIAVIAMAGWLWRSGWFNNMAGLGNADISNDLRSIRINDIDPQFRSIDSNINNL